MVDMANTHGEDCVFIGEDMEVAGAFGMNMALRTLAIKKNWSICHFVKPSLSTQELEPLSGMRPMVEIQFGGFESLGFNAPSTMQQCCVGVGVLIVLIRIP